MNYNNDGGNAKKRDEIKRIPVKSTVKMLVIFYILTSLQQAVTETLKQKSKGC